MSLVINEPIKTVNGLLTLALAAESQLLYTIQTDVVISSVDNYRIEIEVRDAADTFSLFDNVFIYIPNQAGLLDLDVGAIVVNYLKSEGGFSFDYFLRIVEKWEGSGQPSTDTTILQAILAKKQLLSIGGANMYENLLRQTAPSPAALNTFTQATGNNTNFFIDAAEGDLTSLIGPGTPVEISNCEPYIDGIYRIIGSSWDLTNTVLVMPFPFIGNMANPNKQVEFFGATLLTKFKNPIYWEGWNRTISFLIDSQLNARTSQNDVRVREESVDINKANPTFLSSTQYSVSPVRVEIQKLSTNNNPPYIKVKIVTDAQNVDLTIEYFYKLGKECGFPIMLDWINTEGGIEQWLFSQYTTRVISDSGIVAETPITTDIEFITRTKRRFANSFRQQITLRAEHLTGDQLRALQEIKQTESLRVYLSKDGLNYIDGIVVTTFTTEADTKNNLYSYVVIIEFPDGFIFSDGKLY